MWKNTPWFTHFEHEKHGASVMCIYTVPAPPLGRKWKWAWYRPWIIKESVLRSRCWHMLVFIIISVTIWSPAVGDSDSLHASAWIESLFFAAYVRCLISCNLKWTIIRVVRVSQLDCLINTNKSDKKLYLDQIKALCILPKPNNAAPVSQARSKCQAVVSVSEHSLGRIFMLRNPLNVDDGALKVVFVYKWRCTRNQEIMLETRFKVRRHGVVYLWMHQM